MPVYVWKGVDRKGKRQSGEIEADNPTIARQLLIRKGLNITGFKTKPKDLAEYIPFLENRITERELVVFVRQLSTMIDAGLPLVQCLDILQQQQEERALKRILKQVKKDVEEGATFSDAIKKHPKAFDGLFVNLVAAGEMGGILDIILNRLAEYIEKLAKLKKKVKGALTYPAIVVTIAVVVMAVILIYVIPVFAGLFTDAGVSLPPLTLFVMAVSNFAIRYFYWIIIGIGLLIFAFVRSGKNAKGRMVTDRLLLRMPVFGMLHSQGRDGPFCADLGDLAGQRGAHSGCPGYRCRMPLGMP